MAFSTCSARSTMSERDLADAAVAGAAVVVGVVLLVAVLPVAAAAAAVSFFLPRKGLTTLVTIWRNEMTPRPMMTVINMLLFCRALGPLPPSWNPALTLENWTASWNIGSCFKKIIKVTYLNFKRAKKMQQQRDSCKNLIVKAIFWKRMNNALKIIRRTRERELHSHFHFHAPAHHYTPIFLLRLAIPP